MVDLEALARAWLRVGATERYGDGPAYHTAQANARHLEYRAETEGVYYMARPDDPRSWPSLPFRMHWASASGIPRWRFWERDRGDYEHDKTLTDF